MTIIPSSISRPDGHNAVQNFIIVRGATEFIAFLTAVFDGEESKDVRTPDKDGLLIHAEVRIGDATIMLADAKPDWPNIPALTQVYVVDAQEVLDRAVAWGSRVVTEVTPFWGGVQLARFADRWNNLWWLFQPGTEEQKAEAKKRAAETDWKTAKPSYAYSSIMEEMSKRRET